MTDRRDNRPSGEKRSSFRQRRHRRDGVLSGNRKRCTLRGYLWGLILLLSVLTTTAAFGQAKQDLPPGDWELLKQGSNHIYYEPQDKPVAEEMAAWFGTHLRDFADKLGLRMPERVRIFIAPNEGRFRYLTRGLPEWTGGVVYPRSRVMVLQSPSMTGSAGQFKTTALHEAVHLLTELDGASHLPKWLSEGLAMYLSGETMFKNRRALGRAVVAGNTYTLDEIDGVLQLGPEQARVAYLQSIDMVEYIVENWGWNAVAHLVHGYREGMPPDSMFVNITGRDMFDVEANWHQHLRSEYKWWNLFKLVNLDMILWGGASLFVMILGAYTIIRRRIELHSGGEEDEAETLDLHLWDNEVPGDEWYVEVDDDWKP
ncbi:hypothetical protein GF324_03340 [bacterium]|nr:hypothetical protein [bacterium]